MIRLVHGVLVAIVPALVAAPLPRDARPAFGEDGLLSRADLEKVRFDSRPVKNEKRLQRAEEAIEQRKDEAKSGGDADGRPRHANRFDVAVHMPRTIFRTGEPIHAYFVMRNNRNNTLGLTSCIDLIGSSAEMRGGAASFDIRDRATGKSVVTLRSCSTNCGGGSFVDVPANGYYVFRGELSRMAGQQLAPGDYEVEWEYSPLVAAPVRFSVKKADGPKPIAARPSVIHFFRLSESSEAKEQPARADRSVVWRECELSRANTESMAAALAVGQNDAYVPDIRTIPAADNLVEAWVEWKQYRAGDRVSVTLRALPPHREVWFDELPKLYLQIEAPRDDEDRDWSRDDGELKEAKEDATDRPTTPLTTEANLPAEWRERVGVKGSARVAVVVVSKQLELPTRGVRLERAMKAVDRLEFARERPPIWSGTVRTEFVELRFPSSAPRPRQ